MDAHTSPWRGRRVLVTGCTGFLGGAVTRVLLDRGATVIGLVRQRTGGSEFVAERDAGQFHSIHGRAEDAIRLHSAMAVHEVSAVFHLAGTEPFAVLRAAALYHSRMPVLMARPAEQLRLAVDEPAPPVPLGVARFGELFGGRDRNLSRVVPRTVRALLEGNRVTTAASSPRDFVYVQDAAKACLALAAVVGAEARSLDCTFRSGWEVTDSALVALVGDAFLGRTVELKQRDVPNPLGWQPATSFASAIGETIEWYRESVRSHLAPHRLAA